MYTSLQNQLQKVRHNQGLTLVISLLLLGFGNQAFAQLEHGNYYLLGYSLGYASNGAAYGYKNISGKVYDLDYYEDSFTHDTFTFHWVGISRSMYYDVDLQALTIGAFIALASREEDQYGRSQADMSLFPGTGKFKSFSQNLDEHNVDPSSDLRQYGTDYTAIAIDLMFGSDFRIGSHFAINGVGGNNDGLNTDGLSNYQNLRFLSNKLFMSFGLATGHSIFKSLYGILRVNATKTFKNNGEIELGDSAWGFEVFPSLRFISDGSLDFWNSEIGVYAETFLKYRKFFELQTSVVNDNDVTIPGFSTMHLGISAGIYIRD